MNKRKAEIKEIEPNESLEESKDNQPKKKKRTLCKFHEIKRKTVSRSCNRERKRQNKEIEARRC